MNKMKSPVDMLKWIKDISVSKKVWEGFSLDEKKGKYAIGEFLNIDRPDYIERYKEIIKKSSGNGRQ
ncbi:hypothetical protein ES705_42534 [subsurface metagenome]